MADFSKYNEEYTKKPNLFDQRFKHISEKLIKLIEVMLDFVCCGLDYAKVFWTASQVLKEVIESSDKIKPQKSRVPVDHKQSFAYQPLPSSGLLCHASDLKKFVLQFHRLSIFVGYDLFITGESCFFVNDEKTNRVSLHLTNSFDLLHQIVQTHRFH